MAILSEEAWRRHASPASGWTRILSYPLVYLPLWNRSWTQAAAIAAWFAANPVLFDEPDDDSAWMTRVVYGEELWTEDVRKQLRAGAWAEVLSDPVVHINAASVAALIPALRSAWKRDAVPTAVWASAALALQFWYFDRMETRYEESKTETSFWRRDDSLWRRGGPRSPVDRCPIGDLDVVGRVGPRTGPCYRHSHSGRAELCEVFSHPLHRRSPVSHFPII